MAEKKKKPNVPSIEEAVAVAEVVEEKVEVVEEPQRVKAKAEPSVKKLILEVYRDEENRLVIVGEGISKRIAGTDEVFPEVARQIGEVITAGKLI